MRILQQIRLPNLAHNTLRNEKLNPKNAIAR